MKIICSTSIDFSRSRILCGGGGCSASIRHQCHARFSARSVHAPRHEDTRRRMATAGEEAAVVGSGRGPQLDPESFVGVLSKAAARRLRVGRGGDAGDTEEDQAFLDMAFAGSSVGLKVGAQTAEFCCPACRLACLSDVASLPGLPKAKLFSGDQLASLTRSMAELTAATGAGGRKQQPLSKRWTNELLEAIKVGTAVHALNTGL